MQTEHHGGDEIWALIADGKQAADEAEAKPIDRWAWHLVDWMSDPERLFLPHLVEFHALQMHLGSFVLGDRVPGLGVELAEVEAYKILEHETISNQSATIKLARKLKKKHEER